MAEAQANGINLYYEASGSGEPLIFLPGLGGTTELWFYQLRHFQKNYLTISLDNRGAGRSDKPEGPYSMQIFAKDLHDLLNAIGIDQPVNLVGASMGGLIAQAFVHDYPDRVKRLVLACTGVSAADPHITIASPDVMQRLGNPGATPEERVKTILDVFYHPEFVRTHPKVRDLYLERKTAAQPAYAYKAQLMACFDPRPYYEWLKEIAVPTLVIHGRDDIVWPVKNAHTLVEGIGEKGQLAIIDNAAHIFMQEKPEEFNRILETFLQATP